jgi:pimeloyl-ACP methyl ester carboxylesterase
LLTGRAPKLQHRGVKKTVLLVPGLLCDDALWASQVESLSDIADMRVANNGEVDSLGALAEAIIALAPGEAGEREAAGRRSMLALARRSGMRAMARTWLQGMVYPPRLTDAELIEPIVDMFERRTPELYASQIQALLSRPDAKSVFARIHCRSLVLCGREDAWAPPSRHEFMAKMLRHSTFGIIPNCGHMSPLERPRAVSEAFRSWIESMEG